MRSTRAYVASVGASISLIAAAALTLLTVSAIVALEGWPGVGASADGPALIVGDEVLADAGERPAPAPETRPVVLREPAAAPAARREPAARPERRDPAPSRVDAQRASEPTTIREAPQTSRAPSLESSTPETVAPVTPRPRPDAPPVAPRTGDAIRSAGDSLNNTVQSTGQGLQDLTAPVSPQAGQALKDLTVLVGTLLQKTTDQVGGLLDALTKPR